MKPTEMKREILERINQDANVTRKEADALAMIVVTFILNYEGIYDDSFWYEIMDELEA
jgi:hypothetical protein